MMELAFANATFEEGYVVVPAKYEDKQVAMKVDFIINDNVSLTEALVNGEYDSDEEPGRILVNESERDE